MKKLAHLILNAFLYIFFINSPTNTQSISGSEITYSCTSTPGEIEVTLVLYRNCSANTPLICGGNCNQVCTQTIQIRSEDPSCSSLLNSVTLNLTNVRDVQLENNCKNAISMCTNNGCKTPGTFKPGFERYEFKGVANIGATSGIPSQCCNIKFTWSACCRSAALNTGMATQNAFNEATINRCLALSPCNNSPIFNSDPKQFMCGGQNFVFNNSVIDKEFDSLSFSFAPALQGIGNSVTYNLPWAFNRPMPWTGAANGVFPAGIGISPKTGDIMFTPSNASGSDFLGNMTVEVKQWKKINKKSELIGTIRRDIDMIVLGNCPPNNIPRILTEPSNSQNPNLAKFDWEICAGQTLCFNVIGKDTDFIPPMISDTTFLSLSENIKQLGATFKPNYADTAKRSQSGPREDTYRFCWTPHDSNASVNPYYFTIKAQDSRCPIPGNISRNFSIKVLKSSPKLPPYVSLIKTDNYCGNYTLEFINPDSLKQLRYSLYVAKKANDKNFTVETYSYSSSKSTNHYFSENGKFYIFCLIEDISNPDVNTCIPSISFFDSVIITNSSKIDYQITSTQPTCHNKNDGKIEVSPKPETANDKYTYSINHQPFSANRSFDNLLGGLYSISVRDSLGCIKTDSVLLKKPLPVLEKKNLIYLDTTPFKGTIGLYYVKPENYNPTAVFKWKVINGTFQSDTFDAEFRRVLWDGASKIGILSVMAKNYLNCIDTLVQEFTIIPQNGLNDLAKELGLKVFPNPIQNVLNIKLTKLPEEKTMKLYDLQGRLLLSKPLQAEMEIDMHCMQQGLYLLQIGNWHGHVVRE